MSFVFLKKLLSPTSTSARLNREHPGSAGHPAHHGMSFFPYDRLAGEIIPSGCDPRLTIEPEKKPAARAFELTTSETSTSSIDVEANSAPQEGEEPMKKRKWKVDARIVGDAILGLSDGLTVPFALTAGLAFLGDARLVTLGGLAELIAGAISMGLGGYIGTKSEEYVRARVHAATALTSASAATHTKSPSRTPVLWLPARPAIRTHW